MNMLSGLGEMANMIIRPARYVYKLNDLGPKGFTLDGQTATRTDFQARNSRGLKLCASIYSTSHLTEAKHVLIYLHCNSGCRVEGLAYMKKALQAGLTYVVFDFAGSGISEGQYLIEREGFHEVDDLKAVIAELRCLLNQTFKLSLWGRSMGAVTALRFLKEHRQVELAILDSPFESLKSLIVEVGKQKTKLPELVLSMAFDYLKPIIKEKALFDITEIDFSKSELLTACPSIFLASKHDSLIPFEQINSIFNRYRGEKEMFFLEETHNQPRNTEVIEQVFVKIKKLLNESKDRLHRNTFYCFLPQKEASRKKLQLTIKSKSQKSLPPKKEVQEPQFTPLKPLNNARKALDPRVPHKQLSCYVSMKAFREEETVRPQQYFTGGNTPKFNRGCTRKISEFLTKKPEFNFAQPKFQTNSITVNLRSGQQASGTGRDRPPKPLTLRKHPSLLNCQFNENLHPLSYEK